MKERKNRTIRFVLFVAMLSFAAVQILHTESAVLQNNKKIAADKPLYKKQYQTSASSKKTTKAVKAKQAYYILINQLAQDPEGYMSYFKLIDIDQNGIPELILSKTQSGDGSFYSDYYVYAYVNGKVKKLGNAECFILQYSKKSKSLACAGRSSWAGSSYRIYTLKNEKLKNIELYESTDGSANDRKRKLSYNINGKKVSKSKWNKYYKKYYSDAQKITLDITNLYNLNNELL